MRPPDYDIVNEAGEVVAEVAIATGGATGRLGHFSLLFPEDVQIPPGLYTLRRRESGHVVIRFTCEPGDLTEQDDSGVPLRLDLSSKPSG